MAPLSRTEVLDDELVAELARVLWEETEARLVALGAGLPTPRIPTFRNSQSFWTQVIKNARDGAVEGGVAALARQAHLQFPGNEVFARHRCRAPGRASDDRVVPHRFLRQPGHHTGSGPKTKGSENGDGSQLHDESNRAANAHRLPAAPGGSLENFHAVRTPTSVPRSARPTRATLDDAINTGLTTCTPAHTKRHCTIVFLNLTEKVEISLSAGTIVRCSPSVVESVRRQRFYRGSSELGALVLVVGGFPFGPMKLKDPWGRDGSINLRFTDGLWTEHSGIVDSQLESSLGFEVSAGLARALYLIETSTHVWILIEKIDI